MKALVLIPIMRNTEKYERPSGYRSDRRLLNGERVRA